VAFELQADQKLVELMLNVMPGMQKNNNAEYWGQGSIAIQVTNML
jgi:hypothetical protein